MTQQHSDVSSHLKIPLQEYDARIRTFVPYYEEMLDVAASRFALIASRAPTVLELGIGTGALSERCLGHRPEATCIGIDMDADVSRMAAERLGSARVDLRVGSYLELPLPEADFIVASISLHHVRDEEAKRELFRRCRDALRPDGAMILADCYPPHLEAARREGMDAWLHFLERTYTAAESRAFLDAWAEEDTYFPLAQELEWLRDAGFRPDVVWRRDLFAVVAAA